MRTVNGFCAAALVLLCSGTAMAQTTAASSSVPALAPSTDIGAVQSHWTASGFVGANFGSSTSDFTVENKKSWDFGGNVAYLWKGIVGGEFLADFTPNFGVSTFLIQDNPHVNTYMGNVIAVVPIGAKAQFQPYLSGGWGAFQARFPNIPVSDTDTHSISQLTAGGDIGFGIMAFGGGRGKVGIRADARYYKAQDQGGTSGDLADQATQALIGGLSFWRSNVGVAFQF